MTKEEYEAELKKIEEAYEGDKRSLTIRYGMSMAIFKKGDIIKDHRWILLIDKISVNKTFGEVDPVYSGLELKKDLTPRKDGNRVSIFGNKGVELVKSGSL